MKSLKFVKKILVTQLTQQYLVKLIFLYHILVARVKLYIHDKNFSNLRYFICLKWGLWENCAM